MISLEIGVLIGEILLLVSDGFELFRKWYFTLTTKAITVIARHTINKIFL
jgi:hypothetical protein